MIDSLLVPNHEILDSESAEELLKKLHATRDELPKIKASDPALSKIKPNVGDIIKITRKNPSIGGAIYYRVVIEG